MAEAMKANVNPNIVQYFNIKNAGADTIELYNERALFLDPTQCLVEEVRELRKQLAAANGGRSTGLPVIQAGPPLSEVVRLYSEERIQGKRWRGRTAGENRAIYLNLLEVLGDMPFNLIRRQDIVRFRQVMQKIPPNVRKDPRFRGRPLLEVAEMPNIEPMDISTINKNLARVQALFGWAEQHGYTDRNHATGLMVNTDGNQSGKRDAFDDEDLQKLVSAGMYKSGQKPEPYQFWLPLLGMFTGARLEELCQLHSEDIFEQSGTWCISINDDGKKKLKNHASRRLIPVHSKLIELGFINFVTTAKATKPRLFMELRRGRDGYGQVASKWFSRHRKRCGIASEKKTFHSYRHTVSTVLKNVGAPLQFAAAILGHSTKSITYDLYGKDCLVGAIAPYVEQIVYDIDLSHLRDPSLNPYVSASRHD